MKENKFSLSNVVNSSFESLKDCKRKVLISSIIQYSLFLIAYILTRSLIISFVVYATFLPLQTKYLTNIKTSKVEEVFVVGKKILPYLLLSLFVTLVFGVLAALLIFPMVIFFANYALVFDIMGKEDISLNEGFIKAQQKVKGYRGQMTWLCLAFLLILLLFIGFGILIMGLLSLAFPSLSVNANFIWSFVNIPTFYFMGTFLGVSAYLVFIMPIELVCVSNMATEIEKHRQQVQNESNVEQLEKVSPDEIKTDDEVVLKENQKEDVTQGEFVEEKPKDGDNPSDYIF